MMKIPSVRSLQGYQKAGEIIGVIMSVIFACLLAACAADEPVSNSVYSSIPTTYETPKPSVSAAPPTAAPKSTALINAEMEEELEQTFRRNISLDVESMLPLDKGEEWYAINLSNNKKSQWILDIEKHVSGAISNAVEKTVSMYSGRGIRFTIHPAAPSWQYLYILILYAENTSMSSDCIRSSLSVEVGVESGENGMLATVNIGPAYYRDAIAYEVGDSAKNFVAAESLYVYMNTVFDENIKEKKYVLPPAKGNLASGITWPLQKYRVLRKTWYYARDGGNRKHTGTDIKAPEGTEIYSCTDGTVFYIGSSKKGGNTVVIVDGYGYMFHYNHMVSLTDFLKEGESVSAGQLIGHVGSTGNSACNHLHLTIIDPDGILVNPYTYLLDVKPK